jgi:hypothetical protein
MVSTTTIRQASLTPAKPTSSQAGLGAPSELYEQPGQAETDTKYEPLIEPVAAKVYEPLVAREPEAARGRTGDEDPRTVSQDLARRARDAFRDACDEIDQDTSEGNYAAMRSTIEELWRFAKYRDMAFRDLLAMLDAATKHKDLEAFDPTQRDVLRSTFQDLPRWIIEYDVVQTAIQKFAEHGIDITGPIRQRTAKGYRITIEEIN